MREAHETFCREILEELMRRQANDALAIYLMVNPSNVLINMEDLEALNVALRQEVFQLWNDQLQIWLQLMVQDVS